MATNESNSGFFSFLIFVFLEFFVPLENFSLIWRRHHCRRRAANFDLCSALMVIEQWGFFSVPHLLWHGASVNNGHLRGPVTLTPIAERLAVELSLPVLTTGLSRLRFEHQTFRLRGERSNPLRHRRGKACLFGDFRPTREFFTHLETSSLPMKDYKFWPICMLATLGHWAVRVL